MSSAQAQTRGSEVKHIRLLGHARQQKIAQNFVQAVEPSLFFFTKQCVTIVQINLTS